MNKEKLQLLHVLLEEFKMHQDIQLSMGHKYGSRLTVCKRLLIIVKNMLTAS